MKLLRFLQVPLCMGIFLAILNIVASRTARDEPEVVYVAAPIKEPEKPKPPKRKIVCLPPFKSYPSKYHPPPPPPPRCWLDTGGPHEHSEQD